MVRIHYVGDTIAIFRQGYCKESYSGAFTGLLVIAFKML